MDLEDSNDLEVYRYLEVVNDLEVSNYLEVANEPNDLEVSNEPMDLEVSNSQPTIGDVSAVPKFDVNVKFPSSGPPQYYQTWKFVLAESLQATSPFKRHRYTQESLYSEFRASGVWQYPGRVGIRFRPTFKPLWC